MFQVNYIATLFQMFSLWTHRNNLPCDCQSIWLHRYTLITKRTAGERALLSIRAVLWLVEADVEGSVLSSVSVSPQSKAASWAPSSLFNKIINMAWPWFEWNPNGNIWWCASLNRPVRCTSWWWHSHHMLMCFCLLFLFSHFAYIKIACCWVVVGL